MNTEPLQQQLITHVPKRALEMFTGKLLGDGNITIEKRIRGRFRFGHTASDKAWCFHCYQELKTYFPFAPPKYREIKDKRTNIKYKQYYVQSTTHDMIEQLKYCWYEGKQKQLPRSLIDYAMSPLCLAWWYQDDGHLKTGNGVPKKIILSTDSFSLRERNYLKQILFEKFHLDFHPDGQKRLILYNKPSIYYFLHIVRPYIIDGMSRKDIKPTPLNISNFPSTLRTTISLPSFVSITKPTKQIQNALKQLSELMNTLDQNYQELFKTWASESKKWNNTRKPYQIQIPQKELFYLEQFHTKTGFQKGECATFCFIKDRFGI
ncbi:MAG TPA: endonuclease [Bacillales bacterium]|nr:endonuclease [Bacillales bacterium]